MEYDKMPKYQSIPTQCAITMACIGMAFVALAVVSSSRSQEDRRAILHRNRRHAVRVLLGSLRSEVSFENQAVRQFRDSVEEYPEVKHYSDFLDRARHRVEALNRSIATIDGALQ
jgi:hypothetical protein